MLLILLPPSGPPENFVLISTRLPEVVLMILSRVSRSSWKPMLDEALLPASARMTEEALGEMLLMSKI